MRRRCRPGPDADQIDRNIGEMLAAFQLGDVELMHKYYADNVTFVSGAYEPPIVGWQNYVPLYQQPARGISGNAADPAEHDRVPARRRCLGDVSVGIRFDAERTAVFHARPDDADIQQGGRKLADRAQPHVGTPCDACSRTTTRAHRSRRRPRRNLNDDLEREAPQRSKAPNTPPDPQPRHRHEKHA